MVDDFEIYKVKRLRESPEISILPPFVALRKKRKKERETKEKKKRNTFKEDFFKKFKLNKDRFSVNLIKKDDRWFVEIYNEKTRKAFYQDYDTICNILDINCKLPKIIGVNVDERV